MLWGGGGNSVGNIRTTSVLACVGISQGGACQKGDF